MKLTVEDIEKVSDVLQGVVEDTPLQFNNRLSKKFNANIYIKREDLQVVRSFKIRGAFNKMRSLTEKQRQRGVVCASAGNHAQGVAWSCNNLKTHGTIFMPAITPNQKIERVAHFGNGYVDIKLIGTTFDEASCAALEFAKKTSSIYIHPFNDLLTIAGQGTVGKEIIKKLGKDVDYVIVCIGGGGLVSGISLYVKETDSNIKVIGAEPTGAAGMYESLKRNRVVKLDKIDTFVDGAAVGTVGDLTFKIVKKYVDDVIVVPEGQVCTTMIELYQNEGIVAEPAGALSISALDYLAKKIKGKTVVCVLSGGNNDILRYPEIMEKSLVYQGRKYYFLIEFAQKPGQLRRMLDEALGPNDDIVRFEYIKKTNKEKAPAFVGLELKSRADLDLLMKRMDAIDLKYTRLSEKDMLYEYLV